MDKYLSDAVEDRFFTLFDELKSFEPYRSVLEKKWLPMASNKDKLFGPRINTEYISVTKVGTGAMNVDMIAMPSKGLPAVLKIYEYAIENAIDIISGKAQPQKITQTGNNTSRRTRVLMNFYAAVGCVVVDHAVGTMVARVNDATIGRINDIMQRELDKILAR